MKRIVLLLLVFFAAAGGALAQSVQPLVIGGAPKADVRASFGLVENDQRQAANNVAKLQAQLDAGPPVYPWFFPGSTSNSYPFNFNNTIVLPNDNGRSWVGLGRPAPIGIGGGALVGSKLCLRAQSFATTFDGDTVAGSTSGPTATVILTGYQVTALDKFNSVHITGGQNFIPGWYGIADVNVRANAWLLDRPCTVAAGGAMEGYYCPAIIRNHGANTYHHGLGFSFKRLPAGPNPDTKQGLVCYHVATNQQSGGIATGKHDFDNCSFGFAQAGILCGRDLAGYDSPMKRWTGWNDNQADNLTTHKCLFVDCANCILVRNEQSLNHDHTALQAMNLTDAVFRFDAGGKLNASGLEVSGSRGTQAILKLGRRANIQDGPYIVRGFRFDVGPSRNPQLIETDWRESSTGAVVVFDGGILAHNRENDGKYLVDIQSGCRLRLYNIQGCAAGPLSDPHSSGIWPKSVRLRTNANGNFRPHMVVIGCTLSVESQPEEIIDSANSDAGITVEFFGNSTARGEPLPNKTYVTPGT
jgi:hypothetical protein